MSADAILLSKYKKNRPENAFREVVSTREVYGGKMTYFSGSEFFGCFEKHPKVVSGALRGGFRAREVFGSFEKRTPGNRIDHY